MQFEHRHSFGVTSVAVSPDGTKVASGGADKAVRLLEMSDKGEEDAVDQGNGIEQEQQLEQHS